ncbi:MAG: ATP-binding protein [Sulfuricellaceae bacterium]
MKLLQYVVILCISLGGVLLYLLSKASANTVAFTEYYTLLLGLNGILVVCLVGLVGYQLWILRRKLKARMFGAKLTLRLVVLFALMAVLPGMLVYGVSVQFLTKSIESWFDVRVDNALEGGLSLGRSALDNLLRDLAKKGESMALNLSDQPAIAHITRLNSLREQAEVQEVTLYNARGAMIAFSGNERDGLLSVKPSIAIQRQIRHQQPFSAIETIPGKGLYLRVIVPVNVLTLSEDVRILQLLQPVPAELARDAETVQEIYRDYQELSLSRLGLKRIYGLTLTLTLLLSLLSAIAAAFLLSARLSAPLGMLAKGTRAVASGDFSEMPEVHSRDELGILMRSFNSMTRQLADARTVVDFNQQQLETAKVYLESILAHLSSGVLAFDVKFALRTVNPAAAHILGVDFPSFRRRGLSGGTSQEPGVSAFAEEISQQFRAGDSKEWQRQIEFAGKSGKKVLLVRGTRLPVAVGNGYIVVFDDITHLLQAQRDAAWGEVARRLAHEIKNPLTPIQLSAERLEHKLAGKLESNDAEMLRRATGTIVNQVAALKSMVNAFSEYARTPKLNLQQLKLNELVQEVLTLYEHSACHITTALAPDLPEIEGDTTLLRQVIHNLLRNAQDAVAEAAAPEIVLQTSADDKWLRLRVSDNGGGFPEHLMARLFEPYVTTKPKGTGLGLAIVKKIVEEHNGEMLIENLQHGACVSVFLPRLEGRNG